MTVSIALRNIAAAIDELEAEGIEIVDASTDEFLTDDAVSVEIEAQLPVPDVDEPAVEIEPVDATVRDGAVAVSLDLHAQGDAEPVAGVDPDHEPGPAADTEGQAESRAGAGDADAANVPPHRDPERLRAVYEEHDSFAAMTEALDVDVAPNTVRRNMIKHGIHDPDTPPGMGSEDEASDGSEGRKPVHRDPEKLRAVYEEHDSFAAMTEALDADVTPQTVRRNMIDHGIHDPDSSGDDEGEGDGDGGPEGTAGSGEAERTDAADGEAGDVETPMADGIDLPQDTTLDDLKQAVVSGRTVLEIGRMIGVERDRARRLLTELDLLDLATGRISAEGEEITREDVERRIAGATPREV